MRQGDIVRLRQPFRPIAAEVNTYSYGIVAGAVTDSTNTHI